MSVTKGIRSWKRASRDQSRPVDERIIETTDPDDTDAAYTGAPVLVSVDSTLKARAYKTGVNPSGIASAIFLFQSVPTAGLVGQWSRDEGSGTVADDDSSSNNDGSLGSNAAGRRVYTTSSVDCC